MIDHFSIESNQKLGRIFYKGWESSTDKRGHTIFSKSLNGLSYVSHCPNTEKTKIKGSIHKYYSFMSEGLKNANYTQFTRSKLIDAIHHIEAFTGIEATSFRVCSYEFGLNVITQLIVRNLLTKNVIDYKKYKSKKITDDPFFEYNFMNATKTGKQFKFYDKGAQYKTKENILRIETKLRTHKQANTMGVYNLQDLTDPDVWESQFQALKDQLNKLIILDNPKDYPEYNNPKVFEEWRNKKGAKNRKARQRFF